MKICIFHNLPDGGARHSLYEIVKYLHKTNKIDLYTFQDIYTKDKTYFNEITSVKLKNTNNIFGHVIQSLFELRIKSKEISEKISSKNYDLIIIFPCYITQSPYLLQFLSDKSKVLYIFAEQKREYYEKTSADYYSLKKIISRTIRSPIKYIDIYNCRKAEHIICNSYYSKSVISKIYNKNAHVIYPGLEFIKPQKKLLNLNTNYPIVSVGLLSYFKGHADSIKILTKSNFQLKIIGKIYNIDEYLYFKNLSNKFKTNVDFNLNTNDKEKIIFLKESTLYFANNLYEPFGLSTLEAADYFMFILGYNIGGTPEIIKSGLNGMLYPKNIHLGKKTLQLIEKYTQLPIYKITKINWASTSAKIIEYHKNINHEPIY